MAQETFRFCESIGEKQQRDDQRCETTYVDDCDMDAAKPLRALVWKVVRTQFAANDPLQMQKILGVVREAWTRIVPPRVVVFDPLRAITLQRSWNTL